MLRIPRSGIRGMRTHHDAETVSLIVYLDARFAGGGTTFPRWAFNTADAGVPVGHAVVYPGGVSHEHGGRPITSGERHLFLSAFY